MYSLKKIKGLERKEQFKFKTYKIYGEFENKQIPLKNSFEDVFKFCIASFTKEEEKKSNKFSYIVRDKNDNIIFEFSSKRKFISKLYKKQVNKFLKYLKFIQYNFKEDYILDRYSCNPYLSKM